ncbi:MAG: type II toxin-antitoxin system prevent-host-death family antitoxin [Cyanobacteria bacterium J06639_18]
MESINISEFRANLLSYLKKAKEGTELNITSHGEVLATIVPPINRSKLARAKLEELAKTAAIGDVISPIDNEWDMMK